MRDQGCNICGKGKQTCCFCEPYRGQAAAHKRALNLASCRDCRRTFWLNPDHAAKSWAGLSCPSCNAFWKLFRNFEAEEADPGEDGPYGRII